MVFRALTIACLICFMGCGGGDDSSNATTTPASSPDSAGGSSSDETAEEAMMDEHGSESEEPAEPDMAEATIIAEDPEMMEEHGSDDESSSEEMSAEELAMAELYDGESSEAMTPGQRGPKKSSRPAKIEEWTPEHVTEAIRESDTKVIGAIELYAEKTQGQASGVEQLKTWIAVLSEEVAAQQDRPQQEGSEESFYDAAEMEMDASSGGSNGYGQRRGPSEKEQITNALFGALARNSTRPAYEALAAVLSGELKVDEKTKAKEIAFVTLMKNVSDPNNPAEAQLLKALTAVELDGAPPQTEEAESPADKLAKSVKELHLGFAIASMNGLIGANGKAPTKKRNNSNGYVDYQTAEMEDYSGSGSNQPPARNIVGEGHPVKVAAINLNPDEAPKTVSYLWSDEMVAYAVAQLEKHPESAEAFVYAASMPVPETRNAVRQLIEQNKLAPPERWLSDSVIAQQLTDPAIHLLIKQLPRETKPERRPGANDGGNRPRPQRTRDNDEVAERARIREEASYGWMNASEKTLVSLMQRMYEGSLQPDAKEYDPSSVPLALHPGAEVTTSLQFVLPATEAGSPELAKAEKTIVNYIRIESNDMNNRTVQHYRNATRAKNVAQILGNDGMWLDGPVRPYRTNNTIRSVDVLISKNGARPTMTPHDLPQNGSAETSSNDGEEAYAATGQYGESAGKASGVGVVEILTVEIPPPSSEESEEKVTSTN